MAATVRAAVSAGGTSRLMDFLVVRGHREERSDAAIQGQTRRPPAPGSPRPCGARDDGEPRQAKPASFRRDRGDGHVVQDRPEPALDFGDFHPLARRIVLDLVALDLGDAEIMRLGVGDINAAHG
jgi:hypothetical protein